MSKGLICPICKKGNILHKTDSVYVCSNDECGFIGWGIRDEIINVGSGKGRACPNCGCNTLQGVYELSDGKNIWRCTTCSYSGIG
jgi:ribosomal protein L37AE/L43A